MSLMDELTDGFLTRCSTCDDGELIYLARADVLAVLQESGEHHPLLMRGICDEECPACRRDFEGLWCLRVNCIPPTGQPCPVLKERK